MNTKITREQAVEESLEMWKWIYKNPNKSKKDYLDKFKNSEKILHDCYFCEYTRVDGTSRPDCNSCPAYGLWGSETIELAIEDGYFCEFTDVTGNKTAWQKYISVGTDRKLLKQYAGEMVELIKKIDV